MHGRGDGPVTLHSPTPPQLPLCHTQVEELSRTHADRVVGTVCDVRSPEGVEELAAFARDAMGGVDIWINNAGSNGYSYAPLIDTDPHLLKVRAASARALGIQFRDGRRHERNALHWRTVPAAAVTARGSRLAPWAAPPAPSVSFGTRA